MKKINDKKKKQNRKADKRRPKWHPKEFWRLRKRLLTLVGSGEPVLNYKDSCHLRTEYCFMGVRAGNC